MTASTTRATPADIAGARTGLVRQLPADAPLHLVRLIVPLPDLWRFARHAPAGRRPDLARTVHSALMALFGAQAPLLFHVGTAEARQLPVYSYARDDLDALAARAHGTSHPAAPAIDWPESDATPVVFPVAGDRLRIVLRCVVTRQASTIPGRRGTVEFDPFKLERDRIKDALTAAGALPTEITAELRLARERIYLDWLAERLGLPRPALDRVRLVDCHFPLPQAGNSGRPAPTGKDAAMIWPVALFSGTLTVADAARSRDWIVKGIGRHKALPLRRQG